MISYHLPGPHGLRLLRFAAQELPPLNAQVEMAQTWGEARRLVSNALAPAVSDIRELSSQADRLDRDAARAVLVPATMIASSAERAAQSFGRLPGTGLAMFPDVESVLYKLAGPAQHPPHASAWTYWLWDRQCWFLPSDAGEAWFADAVITTNAVNEMVANTVSIVADGGLSLEETAAQLNHASVLLHELQGKLKLMFFGDAAVRPRLTVQGFHRFRSFLLSYPIAGRVRLGANAADLAAQLIVDLILGTATPDYHNVILARLPQMPDEAVSAVCTAREAAAAGLTIPHALCRLLELPGEAAFPDWWPTIRRSILRIQLVTHPEIVPVAEAALAVWDGVRAVSGLHWRMITNFLLKIDPSDLATVRGAASRATASTGEMPHTVPKAIRDGRIHSPFWSDLKPLLHSNQISVVA